MFDGSARTKSTYIIDRWKTCRKENTLHCFPCKRWCKCTRSRCTEWRQPTMAKRFSWVTVYTRAPSLFSDQLISNKEEEQGGEAAKSRPIGELAFFCQEVLVRNPITDRG